MQFFDYPLQLFAYFFSYCQGDADYIKYVKLLEENPRKYVVKSIEIGLELIKNDQTILHTTDAKIRAANQRNPSTFPYIKTIPGQATTSFSNLIFTKNSPLVPVFSKASIKTFEQGQYERIASSWQGQEISALSKNSVDTMILTSGQIFLIFGVLMLSLMSSLVCLLLEIIFFKCKKFMTKI